MYVTIRNRSPFGCLQTTTIKQNSNHDKNDQDCNHDGRRIREYDRAIHLSTPTVLTQSQPQCTVTAYDGFAACLPYADITIQGPFTVPPESKISMTNLRTGTQVRVQGTITFDHSTKLNSSNYLFTISGNNVVFDGTNGTFDGNGPITYFSGIGANGGVPKPKFFRSTLTNSVVRGITMRNSPVHVFSIGGSGTVFEGITVDNSAGYQLGPDGLVLGHNTDAFDVSANNTIIRNNFVRNQDDCMAINNGNNITFVNNYCYGGHGISIGSIKTGQSVSNVLIANSTAERQENGLRIKTVVGATGGYVSNVVYQNITLIDIVYFGIVIQQDYLNGGPTGNPSGGIPITNVSYNNVQGNLLPGANNSIYILCAPGACQNFDFVNVNIAGTPNCTGYSPLPYVCGTGSGTL
ncbi:glycoside hydrolase family 28 protein [Gonapodya prolifera JEL478]|uniref:endo-polygalacturonase n=1 Tax=Gonapodya prolifera (strain JEL478) TaxID=1344416 RepID=A0A139AR87_GONPJ|nr:glycoside hydrolase family 28 protein [Gonapodya prolifera JEL478]|eukprot:KXS19005.1 glycoside hydrolase family 28 protein [Gonapodya prolifera JEL478]